MEAAATVSGWLWTFGSVNPASGGDVSTVKGVSQLFTGAWSDRIGRKGLIVSGMWMQAGASGCWCRGQSFPWWFTAVALLSLGTSIVYPTLLAAISDVAPLNWHGSAVSVYRLWRDGGYAAGALASGKTCWGLMRLSPLSAYLLCCLAWS